MALFSDLLLALVVLQTDTVIRYSTGLAEKRDQPRNSKIGRQNHEDSLRVAYLFYFVAWK